MGDCLSFATFALGATFSSAEVEVEEVVEEVVEVVVEEDVEVEEGHDLFFVLPLLFVPPGQSLFLFLRSLAFSLAFSIFAAYLTQAAESQCWYLVTSTLPKSD